MVFQLAWALGEWKVSNVVPVAFKGFKGGFGEVPSLISMPGKLVDVWLHTIVKIQHSF